MPGAGCQVPESWCGPPLAALPPDVRKVSDLPKKIQKPNEGYALLHFNLIKISQAAKPQLLTASFLEHYLGDRMFRRVGD